MRMKFRALSFLLSLTFFRGVLSLDAAPMTIADILVEPAEQTDLVVSSLPFQVGEMFSSDLVPIARRLLMSTEKFDRVDIFWNSSDAKVKVSVQPRLYFLDVLFLGPQIPRASAIRQACILAYEPRILTQERWTQITQCLQQEIRGRGYLDAEVTIEPQEQNLLVHIEKGSLYLLADARIEGAHQMEVASLLEDLSNQKGRAFDAAEIDADTQRILSAYLKEGYYFAEVLKPQVKIDPEAHRVSLVWHVTESYRMFVTFTGSRQRPRKLLELLDREKTFPRWFLEQIRDDMISDLQGAGYLNAEVAFQKEVAESGSEYVTIHSKKGPLFRLLEPEWIGVSRRDDIHRLYESVSEVSSGSAYQEDHYEKGVKEEFGNLLISRGYLDAKIRSVDVVIDKEKATVKPTIALNEGDIYRVGIGEIQGLPAEFQKRQEVKDLRRVLKSGSPFDVISLEKQQNELKRALAAAGFLDVAIDRKIGKSANTVDVVVNVKAGPLYRIAKVLIRGAQKTHYSVLKREVILRPGDVYEDERIRDAVSQLLRLGIARSVDVQVLEKDVKKGEVYVLVDILEGARFLFEVGPGFGTLDGLRGVFRATYSNIGGTARRLTLLTKGSRQIRAAETPDPARYTKIEETPFFQRRVQLEYFEPSLFGFSVDGRINFTHLKEEKNKLGETNAMTVAVDYRYSRRWIFTTNYELAFSDPFNVPIADDASRKRFTNFGEIIAIDYLDDSFNPHKGFRTRLEGNIFSRFLGGEVTIWQAAVRNEFYVPLWVFRKSRQISFGLGTTTEFSGPFDQTRVVPVEKRFTVGGEKSVRGFKEGAIKPRLKGSSDYQDGGQSTFSFRSELTFPLAFGIDLFGFFDGGNAFLTNQDWRPWKLRYGAGPGLKANTPIGPVKLGFGFLLNPRLGEDFGSLVIDVGPL